jgi:gamma-glutamyltranspeptidase / glutathione hydrolase
MNRGMIVAAQAPAAEAGQRIMADGGNAFDALVAAALVQCVVDPINTSLGGSGCAVHFSASTGRAGCTSFMSRAGSKVRPDMWVGRNEPIDVGYASACVPGNVRGLADLLARHGTISWEAAVEPALEEARRGVTVNRLLVREWSVDVQASPDPFARLTPAAAKVLLLGGKSHYRLGEMIPQPGLVHTLEQLKKYGPDWFYTGEFARVAARDNEENGGWLTCQDFAGYRVRHLLPVTGKYHGMDFFGAPPPASGAAVLHILRILAGYDLRSLGHNTVPYLHLVSEAVKAGFALRESYLGDDFPYEEAISEESAARVRKMIDPDHAKAARAYRGEPGTTHLSVVDPAGNAISMTHSIGNPFGSGVMPPGTGVLLNGHMDSFSCAPGGPNEIGPGRARRTAISATILARGGRPRMVVGASGSARIITSTLQTILNVNEFGMNIGEAVFAPRMRYVEGKIGLERRIPRVTVEALERMGHTLQHSVHAIDPQYGLCQGIVVDERGEVTGAADPRSEGMALGVTR